MAMNRDTRVQINTALAKVIAFRDCNKPKQADEWAVRLMYLLESNHLLKD